MITTCTKCGSMYEAGSEEQAYEPERFCFTCRRKPWKVNAQEKGARWYISHNGEFAFAISQDYADKVCDALNAAEPR